MSSHQKCLKWFIVLKFIQGRFTEIQDEVPLKADLVTIEDIKEVKIELSPKHNNEGQVKEDMEALADNVELIQDWLDDKM